jgi:hypothetical protein
MGPRLAIPQRADGPRPVTDRIPGQIDELVQGHPGRNQQVDLVLLTIQQ